MNLVLGYDGSDRAKAELDDVRLAGFDDEGPDVRVICVGEVLVPEPGCGRPTDCPQGAACSPEQREAAVGMAALRAEQGAERLRAEGVCRSVTAEGAIGSPYLRLIEAAERWPADLVVVGACGQGSFKRFLLGSVADFVMCHCRCSVRIARPNPSSERPVRLVLGVDGSAGARTAVGNLARRWWPAGSSVAVVTAAQTSDAEWTGAERGDLLAIARRLATSTADGLAAAGLSSRAVAREGDPKRLLVEVADELDADVIFMGSRGQSDLDRFGIGSVAAAVAARAHCSVEVIRPMCSKAPAAA